MEDKKNETVIDDQIGGDATLNICACSRNAGVLCINCKIPICGYCMKVSELGPVCNTCFSSEDKSNEAAIPQPQPKGSGKVILDLVLDDLKSRAEFGFKKYGTLLRANNGRDALMDVYQEALDLVMYLRQVIEERDA